MRIPFKNLTLFVIGVLTTILLGFIVTERYLRSDGFEYRRNMYDCLIIYLRSQGMDDAFFPTESPVSPDVDCSEIVKKFDTLEGDVKSHLYSSTKSITRNLCEELTADKKKLCSSTSDVKGSDNQSKTSSCIDLTKYYTRDEILEYEAPESMFDDKMNACENLDACATCITDALDGNNEYKNVVLHAKAVNLTIVNFQVWNYFMISTRVHELLTEADGLEKNALDECKTKGKQQKCIAF